MQDIDYKKKIAQEIGCDIKNLDFLIGPAEFRHILDTINPECYSVGNVLSKNFNEHFKNVIDRKFCINLHSHTNFSDGEYSVEKYLEEALSYSTKLDTPLILSITDHDSFEGIKEAIQIIAQNPEKYKTIKLVTGSEFSVIYDFNRETVEIDMLLYCINPFDEELNNFISNVKAKRRKFLDNVLRECEKYGIFVNKEALKKYHHIIRNTATNGFFTFSKRFLEMSAMEQRKEITFKDKIYPFFENYLEKHSMRLEEIVNLVKSQEYGFSGIAHPGRIVFKNISKQEYEKTFNKFLERIKKVGIDFLEGHYLYSRRYLLTTCDKPENWINIIKTAIDKHGFWQTGGTDSHKSLFEFHDDIDEEGIKKLIS